MSPTTPKFHHALSIFLGLAVAAFAADSSDLAALRAKAEQGNGIAQYNLGLAYADTQQPYADRAEAFVWLSLAAERGSTGKALTSLTEQLTPEQLAEGNRRLQQRRAQLAGVKDAPLPATAAPTPVASAGAPLAKLTAERDQLVASLNATTTELAALRARQAMAAGQPAGETEKLRADLARVENELNEARAAARTLAVKNQQMEDVASERGRALAAAQAELANAKNAPLSPAVLPQLAALTAERDILAEKLARSDRQIALLGNQSMKTLKEMEEQKPLLAELQAKVEKLTGEKNALAARLAIVPAPAPDRSGEIEQLAAAKAAAEARGQELATRLAALERQNAELTARATAAETKLATAQATPAAPVPTVASDASAEEAKKQLAEIEAKLTTALRSYAMLQQELDQTRETTGKASAQAEAKLATAQAEAAALRTQVDSLAPNSKEWTLLRQASVNVATEAVGLRDQLRQAQGSVAQFAEENAQLKTRLALLGPPPAPLLASPARFAPAPPPAATVKSAPARTPPPPAAKPAAAAPPAARQHIVVEGDTLSKISRRYYGTAERWPEILEANRDILRDDRSLPMGATLRIP